MLWEGINDKVSERKQKDITRKQDNIDCQQDNSACEQKHSLPRLLLSQTSSLPLQSAIQRMT